MRSSKTSIGVRARAGWAMARDARTAAAARWGAVARAATLRDAARATGAAVKALRDRGKGERNGGRGGRVGQGGWGGAVRPGSHSSASRNPSWRRRHQARSVPDRRDGGWTSHATGGGHGRRRGRPSAAPNPTPEGPRRCADRLTGSKRRKRFAITARDDHRAMKEAGREAPSRLRVGSPASLGLLGIRGERQRRLRIRSSPRAVERRIRGPSGVALPLRPMERALIAQKAFRCSLFSFSARLAGSCFCARNEK